MTQEQMVLEYLKEHGSITSLQAVYDLGITRLSERIRRLRKEHTIITELVTEENRYGKPTTFARYYLKEA